MNRLFNHHAIPALEPPSSRNLMLKPDLVSSRSSQLNIERRSSIGVIVLASVVQGLDNVLQGINRYSVDSAVRFVITYPIYPLSALYTIIKISSSGVGLIISIAFLDTSLTWCLVARRHPGRKKPSRAVSSVTPPEKIHRKATAL